MAGDNEDQVNIHSERKWKKKVGLTTGFGVLLVVVVILLLLTVILCAIGIDRSDDSVTGGVDIDEYANFLGGATASAVLLAVFLTLLTWVLLLCYAGRNTEQGTEDQELEENDTDGLKEWAMEAKDKVKKLASTAEKAVEKNADKIGNFVVDKGLDAILKQAQKHHVKITTSDKKKIKKGLVALEKDGELVLEEFKHAPIRDHFDPLAIMSVFFSYLTAVLAVMCLVWGIAISFDHNRRFVDDVVHAEVTVRAFIVVEFLVGILLPIFLFISFMLMAVVVDYVTIGYLDFRRLLPSFLPALKLKKFKSHDSTEHHAWILGGSLYYPLKTIEGRKKIKNAKEYSIFKLYFRQDASTWMLVMIAYLAVHISLAYFADVTLDKQVSVTSCTDVRIRNNNFCCFSSRTLNFIDCVNSTSAGLLHCFKFYRFGVDVDLVTSIGATFAFYVGSAYLFIKVITAAKYLYHFKESLLWGVFFIIVGVVGVVSSVGLGIYWIFGYNNSTAKVLQRLNVIVLYQILMVCLFVVIAGGMLVKWQHNRFTVTTGKHPLVQAIEEGEEEKIADTPV